MKPELVLAEWRRAQQALGSAELLTREGYHADAVARTYYALFHAAKAALLAGHRITLYHVLKDYQDAYSTETLAAAYPTLSLALLHKVIAFYLDNQPEVQRYVEETRAEIERQAAAPSRGPSLADLKRALRLQRPRPSPNPNA